MKVSIITIGDEILIGQIVDTNSAWLAQNLTQLGFEIEKLISISDNEEAIYSALENNSSDLLIVTGGLGPTQDDITKKILCDFTGGQMYFDEPAYKRLSALLESRDVPVNELNRNQAMLPDSAQILPNSQGTASGMWFVKDQKHIISLPGVPYEMKAIFEEEIKAQLIRDFKLEKTHYKTIHTTGLAESVLAEKLSSWEEKLREEGLLLAYLPRPGMVRLRIGFKSNDEKKALNLIEKYSSELEAIIPNHIFSFSEQNIEQEVLKLLQQTQKSLCTAESCTGGKIASRITALPGCSAFFKGSVVAYSNEIKNKLLKVPEFLLEEKGAVSKDVVEAMALNACKIFHCDFSLAVSGIAGPDGGSLEKPIGTTWIALAQGDKVISKCFLFGKERHRNQEKATVAAFDMLRIALLDG